MDYEFGIVDPFELKCNPWNSNKVNRKNFEKLKLSLEKYGNFKPVTCRRLDSGELQILGGYHRTEAAKELGIKEIPVIILKNVTEEQAKEIGILDNTRYGEDDKELLEKILDDLTDLEGFESIVPEMEAPVLPLDDGLIEEAMEKFEEEEHEDGLQTIRFRLEPEKAEEVISILEDIAEKNGFKFVDGFKDVNTALYHALVYGAE